MKLTILFAGIILAALFFAGCQDEGAVQAPVSDDPGAAAAVGMIDAEIFAANHQPAGWWNRNFIGVLSGRGEVPPNDSHGRGVAKFEVAKNGARIDYHLIVANIKNVVAAHIHRGGRGQNGPVVFELYSAAPGGGRINGPIARGSFSPADLTGPYAGSTDFSMFMADLHSDSLYVNVHTSDGIDSTIGGPGDLSGGEIRGQLKGHRPNGKGPNLEDQP
jgi:hypothetical protein